MGKPVDGLPLTGPKLADGVEPFWEHGVTVGRHGAHEAAPPGAGGIACDCGSVARQYGANVDNHHMPIFFCWGPMALC